MNIYTNVPIIRGQQSGQINFQRWSILRQPVGPNAGVYIPGSMPPGKVVRFPGSDTRYTVGPAGNLIGI